MSAARAFRIVNLIGFVALIAIFVVTSSVPAAWRLIGALCIMDAAFLFRTGTTEVLGQTTRPIRGVPAYAIAVAAALLGVTLLIFAPELYCSLEPETGSACP